MEFNNLLKPVSRIGLPDRPTPSSRHLAADYYPTGEKIIQEIGNLMELDENEINKMIGELNIRKPDIKADVPNPLFRGPF